MNYTEIIIGAVSGLGGALLTYLGTRRKTLNSQQLDYIDKLQKRLDESEEQIRNLQDEVTTLKANNLLIQHSHINSFPFAVWIMDTSRRFVAGNRAMQQLFLEPRGYKLVDYIGRRHEEIWGRELAEQFERNDSIPLVDGNVFDGIETAPHNGEVKKFRVVKSPLKVGENIIGSINICLPAEPPN